MIRERLISAYIKLLSERASIYPTSNEFKILSEASKVIQKEFTDEEWDEATKRINQ